MATPSSAVAPVATGVDGTSPSSSTMTFALTTGACVAAVRTDTRTLVGRNPLARDVPGDAGSGLCVAVPRRGSGACTASDVEREAEVELGDSGVPSAAQTANALAMTAAPEVRSPRLTRMCTLLLLDSCLVCAGRADGEEQECPGDALLAQLGRDNGAAEAPAGVR